MKFGQAYLKKNTILTIIAMMLTCLPAFAQVSISVSNSNPDSSAMLDIQSSNKGMLVPRMTTAQRNSISNPATGLLVFDTDTGGFWFYAGSTWQDLSGNTPNKISDADQNTQVLVEQSANDDNIRFKIAGNEFARMDGKTFHLNAPGNSLFIGQNAGINDDGNNRHNVFIGSEAGNANTTGLWNTFLGYHAGRSNQTFNGNTFIGSEAGLSSLTGSSNTFVGESAGKNNTTGDSGVFIGESAGGSNTSGSNNTYIGLEAGGNNQTGSNNTIIGHWAGDNNTGSGNIFLGNLAGINETGSNKLYIENSNSASPLIYGEFDNDLLRINGSLNINNNYTFPLTAGTNGQVLATDGSGNVNWSNLISDNLGNHTATMDLNMAGHGITSGGLIQGSDIEIDGTTLGVDPVNNRVGIGLAAPQVQLQVEKFTDPAIFAVERSGASGAVYSNHFAYRFDASHAYSGIGFSNNSTFRIAPISSISSTAPGESGLNITSDGTVHAMQNMDVVDTLHVTNSMIMGVTATSPVGSIELTDDNNNGTTDAMSFNIWDVENGGSKQTPLKLFPSGNIGTGNHWISNDGDNEGIRVRSDGNVGIGITGTSGSQLYVRTSAIDNVVATFESTEDSQTGVSVVVANGASDAQSAFVIFKPNGTTLFDVEGSGKVGIGTTSPDYPLHVIGDAAKTTGPLWTAVSDIRLKHDIRSYDAGLKDVLKIRPVQFKYNEKSGFDTNENHIGVIAQEIQQIAPYMITDFEKDSTTYLGVNPSAMIYMFVNAFKDLEKENQELRDQLEDQKKALADLRDVVNSMRAAADVSTDQHLK